MRPALLRKSRRQQAAVLLPDFKIQLGERARLPVAVDWAQDPWMKEIARRSSAASSRPAARTARCSRLRSMK
jgi:hypothetical protein